MSSITVNAPKTPVTEGSTGIAAATIPNVCKMPGPPAPFVPTPLPNIGKSGDSPKDYSTTVQFEGSKVAIRGATFGSMGDIASKATGGGIVSNNTHGPTSFVGPGSMDVQIEGKNVQLLSDPMLNNNGPSGSPPNSATMIGVMQVPGGMFIYVPGEEICYVCNEAHGAQGQLAESTASNGKCTDLYNKLKARVPPFPEAKMLGVVEALCGLFYANNSGAPAAEIAEDAESVGCIPPAGPLMSVGTFWAQFEERLRKRADQARMQAFRRGRAFASAMLKAAQDPPPAGDHRYVGFPPGVCAAQKALVAAIDKHYPVVGLTEKWFSPSNQPITRPITYEIREPGGPPLKPDDRPEKRFGDGETVPPCSTCEIMLPMILCPRDKKPCDHTS